MKSSSHWASLYIKAPNINKEKKSLPQAESKLVCLVAYRNRVHPQSYLTAVLGAFCISYLSQPLLLPQRS